MPLRVARTRRHPGRSSSRSTSRVCSPSSGAGRCSPTGVREQRNGGRVVDRLAHLRMVERHPVPAVRELRVVLDDVGRGLAPRRPARPASCKRAMSFARVQSAVALRDACIELVSAVSPSPRRCFQRCSVGPGGASPSTARSACQLRRPSPQSRSSGRRPARDRRRAARPRACPLPCRCCTRPLTVRSSTVGPSSAIVGSVCAMSMNWPSPVRRRWRSAASTAKAAWHGIGDVVGIVGAGARGLAPGQPGQVLQAGQRDHARAVAEVARVRALLPLASTSRGR